MKTEESYTTADDGKEILTRIWLPDEPPIATLLIVHGMGEHSARYANFARYLTEMNIAVFGYDHRGHGFTSTDQKGFINGADPYQMMVEDIGLIHDAITKRLPDLPRFLFAHSMGSFLTMRHLQLTSEKPTGVIYSGTSGAVSPLLPFGILFSSLLKNIVGDTYKSELLRNIVFKPYNDTFKPTRTRHDWISSDPEAVDQYVADPNSGFTPSVSFLNHFFKGLRKTQKYQPFSGAYSYPVLIVAGAEDPISNPLNGISKLKQKLRSSGITSLESFVYEGGRHEMLSELNRDEVMRDVGGWMRRILTFWIRSDKHC
jgi:alpha-beta hydrolase superfamily lysophospholipase